MKSSPITIDVSNRICKHMNDDHKDSIKKYAKYYGGIDNPQNVEMLEITHKALYLKVDGEIIKIYFDHDLIDSSDAHRTLVCMSKVVLNSN